MLENSRGTEKYLPLKHQKESTPTSFLEIYFRLLDFFFKPHEDSTEFIMEANTRIFSLVKFILHSITLKYVEAQIEGWGS